MTRHAMSPEEEVRRMVSALRNSTPADKPELLIAKLHMAMTLPGMEELRPLINEEINTLVDREGHA